MLRPVERDESSVQDNRRLRLLAGTAASGKMQLSSYPVVKRRAGEDGIKVGGSWSAGQSWVGVLDEGRRVQAPQGGPGYV